MAEIAIIADDLSGGSAVGSEFAREGLRVEVVGLSGDIGDRAQNCDVVILNTDSRNVERDEAVARNRRAAGQVATVGAGIVIKKIDSLLRGHVGAEIDAIASVLNFDRCLLAAAAPLAGRVTNNGVQYHNGVVLQDALREIDPTARCHSSEIAEILRHQTQQPFRHLFLDTVDKGDQEIKAALDASGPGIVIADATQGWHLSSLVLGARDAGFRFFAGSYGIGTPFSQRMTGGRFPILVIAGSLSDQTAHQAARLGEAPGIRKVVLRLAAEMSDADLSDQVTLLRTEATAALVQGHSLVVLTTADRHAAAESLSQVVVAAEADWRLAVALSDAVEPVLTRFAGVIVSGGSIAQAFLATTGVQGLELLRQEVLPGSSLCRVIGGRCDGMLFLTKPGSFGAETALVEAHMAMTFAAELQGRATREH